MKLSITFASLSLLASPAFAFLPPAPRPTIYATTATKPSISLGLSSTPTSIDIDLLEEANSIFDSIDINQDGSISEAECRSHMIDTMGYCEDSASHIFALMDIDVNGEISREEMTYAFQNYGAINLYMTLGLGGTEVVPGAYSERIKNLTKRSKAEPESWNKLLLDDLADLIFDLIDTDESDEIDKEELREHFDRVTKETVTDGQAKEYVETMFSVLDLNSDNVISREEMRGAFKQYDFRFLCNTLGLPVYKKRNSI